MNVLSLLGGELCRHVRTCPHADNAHHVRTWSHSVCLSEPLSAALDAVWQLIAEDEMIRDAGAFRCANTLPCVAHTAASVRTLASPGLEKQLAVLLITRLAT